ncbi:unnamed protein product [Echinostoma caproni]|uniref:Uncharacterized protein n=1 Tax=Echinostoma caproni TaxID=27848 RepID=A0A3P8I8J3_9TREM|nr:unnamed protein product [Echinostoma caproni]
MWFMLLPSYLASIYASTVEPCSMSNPDRPLNALNDALSQAVLLAFRLRNHRMTCHDQVMMRIVLVLVYQHRPSDIDLSALLNPKLWNSSSTALVNLIFKTFEKECQEKERLQMERTHHLAVHGHRRSASLTHEPPESKHNQVQGNATDSADRGEGCVGESSLVLTHRRSSSTTATSLASPVSNSLAQNKSETDSGLLVSTVGDDSTLDENGEQSNDPILSTLADYQENNLGETLAKQMERMSVTGKKAPLASVNELDLGYSTLHRPETVDLRSSLTSTLRATDLTPSPGFGECLAFGADNPTRSCLSEYILRHHHNRVCSLP